MSERIEVGDLVVAVRGCDACDDGGRCDTIGTVFRVTLIRQSHGTQRCPAQRFYQEHMVAEGYPGAVFALTWLKKIPPLSEPETVEREEELSHS